MGRGRSRGSFRKRRRADTHPATAQREVTGGKGHWSQEGVPTPVPSEAEEASVLSVKCQHPTPMCLPADGEAPSWSSGSSETGQRTCVLTDPQRGDSWLGRPQWSSVWGAQDSTVVPSWSSWEHRRRHELDMLTASVPSARFLCHVLDSLGGGLAHCAVGHGSLSAAVAWLSRAGSHVQCLGSTVIPESYTCCGSSRTRGP